MKLAFSTLGCPEWSLTKVVQAATGYGFDGVELRGLGGELDMRRLPDFGSERVQQTRTLFEEAGIDVVSVDSSARLSDADADRLRGNMEEARDYIALASRIGAPLVRVFGGHIPEGLPLDDAVCGLASRLSALGDVAGESGVCVAVETHDGFLTGQLLGQVMKLVDDESVGVVWDVSNCFWTGEPVEKTAALLAPYLRLVHIKDSIRSGTKVRGTLLGAGDVPIVEVLKILAHLGYAGYLSCEWEKVWQPELPAATEAFPQYVEKMREYLERIASRP